MPIYVLPDLPFDVTACEPWCPAETVELHHGKHHRAYVDGANRTIERLEAADSDDEILLGGLREALAFNVSGHVLHSLMWQTMSPERQKPEGELLAAIDDAFGSVAELTTRLSALATGMPGSGWGALVWDPCGQRLHATAFHDHQHAHLAGTTPLAVVDVWEHAYYLKYRNERAKWVKEAVAHMAWDQIALRFTEARVAATV